jgi:hypothetical protein
MADYVLHTAAKQFGDQSLNALESGKAREQLTRKNVKDS